MGFLRRLLRLCGNWLLKPAHEAEQCSPALPVVLGPGELLARFLHHKRHFSIQKMLPKPGAFDPSPYSELSTAHITGLLDASVWSVAREALGDDPDRGEICARVDFPVSELIENRLRAERDDEPFVRHTLVLGWPAMDDPDQKKKAWKEICLKLSQSPRVKLVIATHPVRR
jgi:hypothetical protein